MKHIPNILSCFRIILIPFFVWQMLKGNAQIAGVLILISGLTDFLDGFLARRFNWISQVGKVLDPLADKLTQITVFLLLIVHMGGFWPFFAIMLVKEVVMIAGGAYLMKKDVVLEGAKWFGKVSTFLFYTVVILILIVPSIPRWVNIVLLVLMTGSSLLSLVFYTPQFLEHKKVSSGVVENDLS